MAIIMKGRWQLSNFNVKLSHDLTARFGNGFGAVNLSQMKRFYLLWPQDRIFQALSEKFSPPRRNLCVIFSIGQSFSLGNTGG
jgi:hypothetical protein